ncbi:FAS-associated death domain protein [Glossophaga mutica]
MLRPDVSFRWRDRKDLRRGSRGDPGCADHGAGDRQGPGSSRRAGFAPARWPPSPAAMDPFLVLLHSMSTRLSTSEVSDLKFLCQDRLSKRKLERVQSGIDLFSLLLEQNELDRENPERLRELLTSLKRQDLLRLLDDFEEGAEVTARQEEQDFHAAFDIICDHVGKDWRRLARQLKVPDSKIDAIEVKYPRNLSEQVRESLRVWKKAAREHATVSHLVQALRACRLNLVADLVEEDQQVRGLQLQSGSGGGTVSLKAWDSGAPAPGASP